MEKTELTALAWLALWLFILGIAGQAAAVALLALDLPRASGTVHTVFRILTAVALIRLFGFVLFRLLLPLAGKRPTRIVEDLAIVLS